MELLHPSTNPPHFWRKGSKASGGRALTRVIGHRPGPSEPMPGQPNSADNGPWIRAVVARFEGPLTLYAARLLGDAESARDVVQETFLRLCAQDRATIEPRLAEWLFTVCRNRALDVLRKESRMTRLSDEQVHRCTSADPGPPEVAVHREAAARVLDLLETLPPNQREVIRLKFQNGFSYQEISRISGHSVTNVGYLLHVGLKSLRHQLLDGQPAEATS
jgi:RNA polymerase sigma factor (sigma-70 family)